MIIAVIALVVVGPKDLPMLMRKVGQFVNRARTMAADFRTSFDDMARQSELDELRKEVEAMRATAETTMGAENAEVAQALTFEQDPMFSGFDPYADMSGNEPAPETAAEPAQKPARKRKKAEPAPAAEIVTPASKPRRKKTADIVS
ncbi:hypothetical protein BH11PSE2_BH11PSE2_06010 [soil metagenome]